jgi:hypothetical protein
MRPFETADVAFFETLKARHEALKAKLAAAERAADAQHAAKIAAELQEMAHMGRVRSGVMFSFSRGRLQSVSRYLRSEPDYATWSFPHQIKLVVVQTLEVEPIRGLEVALDHAASTAFQISGAVLYLTRSLSSLN